MRAAARRPGCVPVLSVAPFLSVMPFPPSVSRDLLSSCSIPPHSRSATIGSTARRAARRDVAGQRSRRRAAGPSRRRTPTTSCGADAEQQRLQIAASARPTPARPSTMPMPAVRRPCFSTSDRIDAAIGAERLADAELARRAARRRTPARRRCRSPTAPARRAPNSASSIIGVRRLSSDRAIHCSIVRTSAIGCSGSIDCDGGAHLRRPASADRGRSSATSAIAGRGCCATG